MLFGSKCTSRPKMHVGRPKAFWCYASATSNSSGRACEECIPAPTPTETSLRWSHVGEIQKLFIFYSEITFWAQNAFPGENCTLVPFSLQNHILGPESIVGPKLHFWAQNAFLGQDCILGPKCMLGTQMLPGREGAR